MSLTTSRCDQLNLLSLSVLDRCWQEHRMNQNVVCETIKYLLCWQYTIFFCLV